MEFILKKRYTKKRTRYFRTQVYDNHTNTWVYASTLDYNEKSKVDTLPHDIFFGDSSGGFSTGGSSSFDGGSSCDGGC